MRRILCLVLLAPLAACSSGGKTKIDPARQAVDRRVTNEGEYRRGRIIVGGKEGDVYAPPFDYFAPVKK